MTIVSLSAWLAMAMQAAMTAVAPPVSVDFRPLLGCMSYPCELELLLVLWLLLVDWKAVEVLELVLWNAVDGDELLLALLVLLLLLWYAVDELVLLVDSLDALDALDGLDELLLWKAVEDVELVEVDEWLDSPELDDVLHELVDELDLELLDVEAKAVLLLVLPVDELDSVSLLVEVEDADDSLDELVLDELVDSDWELEVVTLVGELSLLDELESVSELLLLSVSLLLVLALDSVLLVDVADVSDDDDDDALLWYAEDELLELDADDSSASSANVADWAPRQRKITPSSAFRPVM